MTWMPPDPAHGPEAGEGYDRSAPPAPQWRGQPGQWPAAPAWHWGPQPYSRTPHTEPQPYHRLLRTQRYRWWRPLAGLPLAVAAVLAIGIVTGVVAVVVALIATGSVPENPEKFLEMESPAGLLLGNLTLASLIPAAWAAVALVHRERIGWLSSVVCGLRSRFLLRSALLAVAVVIPAYIAYLFLPGDGEPGSSTDGGWPGAQRFVVLAAITLLTTPLQAAGEEYAFRGYISQAIGSWVRSPWVPALLSAGLFALAHGSQEPLLFLDRFAFGLTASFLVIRTGGLEAGIALHAVNNVVSLLIAAALGQLESAFTATDIPWPVLAVDLVMLAAFAALVLRSARRRKLVVRSAAPPAAERVPA